MTAEASIITQEGNPTSTHLPHAINYPLIRQTGAHHDQVHTCAWRYSRFQEMGSRRHERRSLSVKDKCFPFMYKKVANACCLYVIHWLLCRYWRWKHTYFGKSVKLYSNGRIRNAAKRVIDRLCDNASPGKHSISQAYRVEGLCKQHGRRTSEQRNNLSWLAFSPSEDDL